MTGPFVLDCDPGLDDALALQYALGTGRYDIKAVTAVGGNAPVEHTYRNARALVKLFGVAEHIPVHRGVGGKLSRRIEQSASFAFHGESGLGDEKVDDSGVPVQSESAVDALLRLSHEYEHELIVVATGPLTNIAAALIQDPGFAHRIGKLVFMGGTVLEKGNVTPTAEFNIWHDPEAADLVASSGANMTMIGLDVTHKARFTRDHLARLERAGEPLEFTVRMLKFYFGSYNHFHRTDSVPLHDPLAIGVALDQAFVQTEKGTLFVETASPLTTGQTVFLHEHDAPGTSLPPHLTARTETSNAHAALDLGPKDFIEEFTSVLEQWGQ
ncbi:nucleoside hydrolase [Actinospica durhamensis]|uniref:Nucleoside hydrolase n=1 Tax=Actinospica durhamensis TaxID=1508375 RepID=A0A941EWS4_9ACTN|nr:nucleoside hydrolase [Actinospica durhamensis]MBR7838733.1 nucleoside hydrolase [Actinospica durhamensis]